MSEKDIELMARVKRIREATGMEIHAAIRRAQIEILSEDITHEQSLRYDHAHSISDEILVLLARTVELLQ